MKEEGGEDILIRRARKEDSGAIAGLFRISSDGLADYIWSRLESGAGRSLIEIGLARYEREGVPFSYQNCVIAERGGRIAGMIHCFPMEPPDPPVDPAVDPTVDPAANPTVDPPDPVLAPYAELEDEGSLYISGLALWPEDRNAGIGTRLLAAAAARTLDLGLPRLSLICFEANHRAMRLYRRLGFIEVARRPLVPHPCLKYESGDAVLMALTLAADAPAPPVSEPR